MYDFYAARLLQRVENFVTTIPKNYFRVLEDEATTETVCNRVRYTAC